MQLSWSQAQYSHHHFFGTQTKEHKELCPICKSSLVPYGRLRNAG